MITHAFNCKLDVSHHHIILHYATSSRELGWKFIRSRCRLKYFMITNPLL